MGMGDVSGFEKKKKRIRKHTNRLPLPKENHIIFLTGAWAPWHAKTVTKGDPINHLTSFVSGNQKGCSI